MRELQSLTGLIQHATAVVRPGRAFLQRLYALQRVGSEPSHNIRLNTVARADIIWWELFGMASQCWSTQSRTWQTQQ